MRIKNCNYYYYYYYYSKNLSHVSHEIRNLRHCLQCLAVFQSIYENSLLHCKTNFIAWLIANLKGIQAIKHLSKAFQSG